MLKHIITTSCKRRCGYCITKNMDIPQFTDLNLIKMLYQNLSREHSGIMLTGGEPTEAEDFREISMIAWSSFKAVYLTTQNEDALINPYYRRFFEAITFSIHEPNTYRNYRVKNNAKVYAAIMTKLYEPNIAYTLKANGFAGLTINEDQRDKFDIFNEPLPRIPGFSIRVNERGKCITDKMILPDLTLTNNYSIYL